jgi:DedD protein
MFLAFWRRKKTAADATSPRSSRKAVSDDDSARADPAPALRARARRRLIGAAALLLLVIIVVPMVLDPEPRPVADNIPIDIPSEKSKFSPRLALPPVPAANNTPLAPPPDTAPTAVEAGKAAPRSATTEKATDNPARPAETAKTDEQRARAALEGKAAVDRVPVPAKGGKFAVQAAATSTEVAARDLSERLKKEGHAPYTERVDTVEGARYRVRVGPYASREDADKVRARLKALGINANVVSS